MNFSKSTTEKAIFKYFGIFNFYRRIIPRTSEVKAPLTSLLTDRAKGNKLIEWRSEAHQAFNSSKKYLADDATLAHATLKVPLALLTDASYTAIGAAL